MADDPEQTQIPGSAEAAMNEVLAAEQAAEQAIGVCEQEARASLYEAAQRARQIAGRANERIAIIHQRTRQQLKNRRQSAERVARDDERTHAREDPRKAVVSAVVSDLAARLTGSDSSDTARAD
jgi:vacuolar-type H+-ATPase subunit H